MADGRFGIYGGQYIRNSYERSKRAESAYNFIKR